MSDHQAQFGRVNIADGLMWGITALVITWGVLSHHALQQPLVTPPDYVKPPARISNVPETDYLEIGKVATGLRRSRGLALGAGDRLYVAGDQTVLRFDANRKVDWRLPLAGAPACLAAAPDGTLYVGLRDHVERYSAAGKLTACWTSPGKRAYLTALAPAGTNLWAADAGDRVVVRYNSAGKITARVGALRGEDDATGLVVPSPHLDMAMAHDGRLWVANPGRHLLQAYTADGKVTASWGKYGYDAASFTGCCNPTDFALLPDGRFVTAEKGAVCVKVFSASGKYQGLVAAPESFAPGDTGLDLAVDGKGHVLVLDPALNAVRVFAPKSEVTR